MSLCRNAKAKQLLALRKHAHLFCMMLHVVFTKRNMVALMSVQAGEQLGPDWTLMKAGTEGCPEIPQWLASNLAEPGRVGIDPYLHTVRPSPLQKILDAKVQLLNRFGAVNNFVLNSAISLVLDSLR